MLVIKREHDVSKENWYIHKQIYTNPWYYDK